MKEAPPINIIQLVRPKTWFIWAGWNRRL